MKHRTRRLAGLALGTLTLAGLGPRALAGGAPASSPAPSINIRAWIDGRSRLILDDDTAQWLHLDFAAPGRLDCNIGEPIEATFLDGAPWFPDWPDVPDCENRGCGCVSSVFSGLSNATPNEEFIPVIVPIQVRGLALVVEPPTAANGFRVVIEFDDNPQGGAAWYEIQLIFGECGSESFCPSTANSSGQPASLDVAGSLSVLGPDTLLQASSCPAGYPGLFIYGKNATHLALFNGFLCVSPFEPGILRIEPTVMISPQGEAQMQLDFGALPAEGQIAPGSTWIFQFWFRDPPSGGAGANLTNALRVTFCS